MLHENVANASPIASGLYPSRAHKGCTSYAMRVGRGVSLGECFTVLLVWEGSAVLLTYSLHFIRHPLENPHFLIYHKLPRTKEAAV